jgi:hypothetical protein
METNYSQGRNGKKVQSDEVIGMQTDIRDLTDENIAKDAFRYISKKEGMGEHTTPEKMITTGKSKAAEKKAFRMLSKQQPAKGPVGTVGPIVPMEIRVKQLSLFPGIY